MSAAIAAILAVAGAVLAALLLPPLWRRRRRRQAFAKELPAPLCAAIARNVPASRSLPAPLARRLEGLVISFLREKQFVGCNGLAITDEIRATIAAQACLLLLGRPGLYDELQSILVYPGTFWVEDEVHDDDGLVTQRRRELSGEAWDSHRIILSWADIAETARQPADGYNVVLHEFAPGMRSCWTNTRRCAKSSIAAKRHSWIRTRPKTRPSSSPSRAKNSSSARRNCGRRIRGCTRCSGSSTGSIRRSGARLSSPLRAQYPRGGANPASGARGTP
jgi:hypothetical protein